jgi:hypothetical protein
MVAEDPNSNRRQNKNGGRACKPDSENCLGFSISCVESIVGLTQLTSFPDILSQKSKMLASFWRVLKRRDRENAYVN